MASLITTRPLFDAPDRENRHLRLVDDRKRERRPEGAWIGDGEGAVLYFVGLETFGATPCGEIANAATQVTHAHAVGVFQHRGQ